MTQTSEGGRKSAPLLVFSWMLYSYQLATNQRKKWQPTPVFLSGESQGQGSLVGCHLWGHSQSDMTEATQQQQQLSSQVLSLRWNRLDKPVWFTQANVLLSYVNETVFAWIPAFLQDSCQSFSGPGQLTLCQCYLKMHVVGEGPGASL